MTLPPTLLSEMATLTALSNRISDKQAYNLKLYPYVYFDGLDEVRVQYDLSNKADVLEDAATDKLIISEPTKNLSVSYYLTFNQEAEHKENPNKEARFKALEKAVRNLFWNSVSVEVYFGDAIVYKSVKV